MIIGLAFMQSLNNIVTPMIQDLIQENPDISPIFIRGLVTIPPIISLGLSIIISYFMRENTKIKPIMIAAATLTVLGSLPFFIGKANVYLIFTTQILVACGAACCMLRNACVNLIFPDDITSQKVWIGRSQTFENLMPMILTPIAGYIASKRMSNSFMLYLIALLPLIFYVSYKEPKDFRVNLTENTENFTVKGGVSINKGIVYHVLMIAFITMTTFPLMTAMSTFIAGKGLGGPSEAGAAIGIYEAGNVIGCILFEFLTKKCAKFERTISYGLLLIGFITIYCAKSVPIISAGMFLSGVGFIMLYLLHINYAGESANDNTKGFALTVATAAPQLGVFLSSFWITMIYPIGKHISGVSNDAESAFIIAAIIQASVTAMYVIADIKGKKIRG